MHLIENITINEITSGKHLLYKCTKPLSSKTELLYVQYNNSATYKKNIQQKNLKQKT